MVRFEAKKILFGCRCGDCFSGDPVVVGEFYDYGIVDGLYLSVMKIERFIIESRVHTHVSTVEREAHDLAMLRGFGFEFIDVIDS